MQPTERNLIDPAVIGRKGGLNSRKNIPPHVRTALAKKAADIRWGRRSTTAALGARQNLDGHPTPWATNCCEHAVWSARFHFFAALQRLVPVALQRLASDVMPVFQALMPVLNGQDYGDALEPNDAKTSEGRGVEYMTLRVGRGLRFLSFTTIQKIADEICPALRPVCDRMEGWGRALELTELAGEKSPSNVAAAWALNTAWATLHVWALQPPESRSLVWYFPDIYGQLPSKLHLAIDAFHFYEYDPSREKWRDFERSFRPSLAEFVNGLLERYKQEVETFWRGYRKLKVEHYEWVALYQVLGQSPRQIADRILIQSQNLP